MPAVRKQAVSLRIGASDLRRVKQLGQRIGVGDSEIIRFALKVMLSKLAPLCDPAMHGSRLLPMFVHDYANDFLQHFALDSARLDEIVNAGAGEDLRVDIEDLQFIALAGMRQVFDGSGPRSAQVRAVDDQSTTQDTDVSALRRFAARNVQSGASNAVVGVMADGKK